MNAGLHEAEYEAANVGNQRRRYAVRWIDLLGFRSTKHEPR